MTMQKFAILALMVAVVAGCNTVEGMGRDVSDAAVAVRDWFR
jgi:predicted small secreted protein